jgi:hypothetical protein
MLGNTEEGGAETPALLQGEGKVNGWMEADLTAEPVQLRGVLNVAAASLLAELGVQLQLVNANLEIPFAYPLDFTRFPAQEARVQAQAIRVNQQTFESVDAVLPLTAERAEILRDLDLNLYGGRVHIDHLRLADWQTEVKKVLASFTLENLQMESLQTLSKLFPQRGTLSGSIPRLEISREVLSASGELQMKVFDGTIDLQDVAIHDPFSPYRTLSLNLSLQEINLKALTDYFNYGEMTGFISGTMNRVELILPPRDSDELPQPVSFDIEIHNVKQNYGMVSREAMQKIVKLGNSSAAAELIDRDKYYYNQLGLRAILKGNQLQMYGTAEGNRFLHFDPVRRIFSPRDWFDIPAEVMLAKPGEIIPFDMVWNTLMNQIKRTDTGPPTVEMK